MGNSELFEQRNGAIWFGDNYHAFYSSYISCVDDIVGQIEKVTKMATYKFIYFVLSAFGIPCGLWAWFLEVNARFDLIKGIVLLVIGGFTGVVIGLRYLVKLLTEWKEYKRKYK